MRKNIEDCISLVIKSLAGYRACILNRLLYAMKKWVSKFRPTLEGDDYSGLVTVIAVIVSIEYAGGPYDIWDIAIAFLSIGLGYSFMPKARVKKDYWYSFLASSLIGLGMVCLWSYIYQVKKWGFANDVRQPLSQCADFIRFILFLIVTIVFQLKVAHEGSDAV